MEVKPKMKIMRYTENLNSKTDTPQKKTHRQINIQATRESRAIEMGLQSKKF